MKIKYLLLSFFLFTGLNFSSFGQDFYMIQNKKEALKIRNNTLAVVLEVPNPKTEKHIKDPKELAAYRKAIEERNIFLREALEEGWDLSREIIYVSSDEAEVLKKKKSQDVSILKFINLPTRTGRTENQPGMPNYNPNMKGPGLPIVGISIPSLSISNASMKIPIATSNVPLMEDKSTQITYMVAHLQNLILDAEQKKISSYKKLAKDIASQTWQISGKTILVTDTIISKNLAKALSNNEINGHYNFVIETASAVKIKQVMLEKNDQYAFFMVYPDGRIVRGKLAYEYYVVDAATRKIIYNDSMAVLGSHGRIHTSHLQRLNKKLNKSKS